MSFLLCYNSESWKAAIVVAYFIIYLFSGNSSVCIGWHKVAITLKAHLLLWSRMLQMMFCGGFEFLQTHDRSYDELGRMRPGYVYVKKSAQGHCFIMWGQGWAMFPVRKNVSHRTRPASSPDLWPVTLVFNCAQLGIQSGTDQIWLIE